jgi:hypothetical protein
LPVEPARATTRSVMAKSSRRAPSPIDGRDNPTAIVAGLKREATSEDVMDIARAKLALAQIRAVRGRLLAALADCADPKQLKRLARIERYERAEMGRQKRALRRLGAP